MTNKLGEVRRSAVIMNYGPGAVIDFRLPRSGAATSVISGGLEAWEERAATRGVAGAQTIHEPRLQRKLAVHGFRLPPVAPEDRTDSDVLLGVLFPQWLVCSSCNALKPMNKWAADPGNPARYCGACSATLAGGRKIYVVPVRFVTACENGHIDEFPWHFWVGHRPDCKNRTRLKLESEGAGLAGLMLRCHKCTASKSLENIFKQGALSGLTCRGRRPWIPGGDQECPLSPVVMQRGASNLYFPQIASAIDIPPWSDNVQKALGTFWSYITNIPDASQRRQFLKTVWTGLGLLDRTEDEVSVAIEQRLQLLSEPERLNIRWDEFRQLTSSNARGVVDEDFDCRAEEVSHRLHTLVSHLVRVVRLREVRALTGFTRISPVPGRASREGGAEVQLATLSKRSFVWVPAIEVRGEGIFLSLSDSDVSEWAAQPEVTARMQPIIPLLSEARTLFEDDKIAPSAQLTARFVLAHTLAHALIRQLALQSGYSSASLRERLFVGDAPEPSTGLMIYTASPDADGTLGGLQRLGKIQRFEPIFRQALESMRWCSSDPLCVEGVTAATEPTNLAACHSCVLASETSCEEYNLFLDRALLVGTPQNASVGYFSALLEY